MTKKVIRKYYRDGIEYRIKFNKGWQPGANTLGYWKLNGDVLDYSGNHNNGTLYNAERLNENSRQYLQGTYSTNRTGAYVILPKISVSQFTTNIRVKKNRTNSDYGVIFGIYFGGNSNSTLGSISGNNQYYWSNVRTNSLESIGYPTTITDGWNLITWVVANGQQLFYYNATLIESKTLTGINFGTSSNNNWTLNACNEDSRTLGNAYGDLILESVPRTAQEIADYYNNTKSNYGL